MKINQESILSNYAKAVAVGAYDRRHSYQFGKQDYVRRNWEDKYTRRVLSPFIQELHEDKKSSNQGIRVMDLGCGAGEGLSILTTLPQTSTTLDVISNKVLDYPNIDSYKGVDISPAMIAKAKALYNECSQAEFVVADLNDGLPVTSEEEAYDVYISSYGSLSHLNDASLSNLIGGICHHMGERAIFVADLLGKYSYEWPCYWGDSGSDGAQMRNYSMSYIYPPDTRASAQVEVFPIRYWGGEELEKLISKISEDNSVKIRRYALCDRSILVGRHMDTREYNSKAPSLRSAINSLYEPNCRTDLNQLIFKYEPHSQYSHLNRFFQNLQTAWNSIVYGSMEALSEWRNIEKLQAEPQIQNPPLVLNSNRIIRRLVHQAQFLQFDDPRANLVEPQLAYLLRDLEWNLQQGLGAAHGLVAIYEFCR